MLAVTRETFMPESNLPRGAALLDEGRALARSWRLGPSAFLAENSVSSEFQFKKSMMQCGRIMQHAQIGYRDLAKSCRAYYEIWEGCARHGVTVDRYGLCLDWSMALPRERRVGATRGTGMILDDVEDFVRLANSAPVAPHFGDFVLGFPGAIENVQAALAAGSTAIGNLGQYFTFRVPGWDDDVEATRATVVALGLIAAQPVPVMVHSNIDDGYAAQFTDLASCFGMILIERDIVMRLVGAPIGHCYGHHFSDPLSRMAFQKALADTGGAPGTVIYGNTTSYRGTAAQNYAGLASYLLTDAVGQIVNPTGHAINAVPVTENERIPEIEEVIDAQLFAGRLKDHAASYPKLIDPREVERVAERIRRGGEAFMRNVMHGFEEGGVDTDDAFEMLLALRRIGARRLETAFGAGVKDATAPGGRRPLVTATILAEIAKAAANTIRKADDGTFIARLSDSGLTVMIATSDVHEHGKMLIEQILRDLSVKIEDGGVSTDPEKLADLAGRIRPDAIAISTYNGVALSYYRSLVGQLKERGLDIPILIGGRLNQIPEGSNSSLPVDVGDELEQEGALVCRDASALLPMLARVAGLSCDAQSS